MLAIRSSRLFFTIACEVVRLYIADMSDKRRHQRFGTEIPAVVRHLGRLIPASIKNVSTGGMFVVTESNDVSSTSPLELIFDLGNSNGELSVMGRIRHLERTDDEAYLGVQFTTPFADGMKGILSFCSSNSAV